MSWGASFITLTGERSGIFPKHRFIGSGLHLQDVEMDEVLKGIVPRFDEVYALAAGDTGEPNTSYGRVASDLPENVFHFYGKQPTFYNMGNATLSIPDGIITPDNLIVSYVRDNWGKVEHAVHIEEKKLGRISSKLIITSCKSTT
jgi:hypothetical protein